MGEMYIKHIINKYETDNKLHSFLDNEHNRMAISPPKGMSLKINLCRFCFEKLHAMEYGQVYVNIYIR